MAFNVSLTASVTASSAASGSAIRLVKRRAGFTRRVRLDGATNDLHNLRQARSIADRQRVLAPDPIETFLRHAQGNDDVHVIAVVLLPGVLQRRRDAVALGGGVVNQVGDPQDAALLRLN